MDNKYDSKWGCAAKEGLVLALVTVVVMTLGMITKSAFLSMLLWAIKLVGSIWILAIFMKRYGAAHPGERTFSYGAMVCLCSSAVCAIYTLLLYGFLFPDAASMAIEQTMEALSQYELPQMEEVTDAIAKVEDNYAQIQCITSFFWCTVFGLMVSAVLSRSTSAAKNIFEDEEL